MGKSGAIRSCARFVAEPFDKLRMRKGGCYREVKRGARTQHEGRDLRRNCQYHSAPLAMTGANRSYLGLRSPFFGARKVIQKS